MGREGDAAELLELVRSAEQGAFVATTPSGNPLPTPPDEEEFVDVGDEAIEATPSLALPIPRVSVVEAERRSPSSPLVAILGVMAIAAAVLALVAR